MLSTAPYSLAIPTIAWKINSTHNTTIVNTTEIQTESFNLRTTLSISMTVGIAIVMVGMGCGIDVTKLKHHLQKPTAVIVGAVSQFVFMPIVALSLAKAFQMSDIRTLALLVVGSCPGGSASNTMTYWVGGDIGLSVTMTTVSSTLAFGMMPLLLWLYSFTIDGYLSIPYQSIGVTLVALLVPVFVGILIRIKFPKQAPTILKVLAVFGIVMIIGIAVFGFVVYSKLLYLTSSQIICATLFPFLGMVLGYGLSSLISMHKSLWLPHYQRRTISIETGIQNGHLAAAVIQLSNFSAEETGQVLLFPVAYACSQLVWVLVITGVHQIYLCSNKADRLQGQSRNSGIEISPNATAMQGKVNDAFDFDSITTRSGVKERSKVVMKGSAV